VPATWIDLGVLNDVLFQFEDASTRWVTALEPVALKTFYTLGTIELAWSGIRSALSHQGGFEAFFELLIRKTIYLGMVLWLITVAPGLLPVVVGSFQQAGALASGVSGLHPSSFLATGVSIAITYLDHASSLGLLIDPLGIYMAAFGALLTVGAFACMSATLLATLVESLLAISATPFLLAMAGSRWTARIAEGALAHVVRIGIKLFVLYLIAGVANSLTIAWAERINSETIGPVTYLGFMGSVYCLAMVVWSVPRYAASMIQPGLSFGLTPAVGDN
jgi:type IV secretion system protein TrbL